MSTDATTAPDQRADGAQPQAGHLRSRIDRIDRELVALLADRARLIDQLIAMPPDPAPEREERVLRMIARRRGWAAKAGLDRGFTEVLFAVLLARDSAVRMHRRALPHAPTESAGALPSDRFRTQS